MGYELTKGVEPLDFGTAIHEGMEIIYDPERWDNPRDVVYVEARTAFVKYMHSWRTRMRDIKSYGEVEEGRWEELVALGNAMLNHYQTWVEEEHRDQDWVPKHAEVEFEMPIPVPPELISQVNENPDLLFRAYSIADLKGLYLHKWDEENGLYVPVLFQGRIDVIVESLRTGKYWIVDHKTAAQFWEDSTYLDMDAQAGRYCWAIKRQLGIDVEGVIFNQMRKKAPEQPAQVQNGGLSKNKASKTTPALYRAKIKELGLDPAEYEHFLSYFEGQEYFRRVETFRSADEMDILGTEILGEAIDMLSDPWMYRNPNQFVCTNCQFRVPCIMRHDGSDWKWFLENSGQYTKRN